jgi:hypothetical protein
VSIVIDKEKLIRALVLEGGLVEESSYIIFTDGSKYHARSGSTGAIEYSDTDASNVFQYVADKLMNDGGTIFVKTGTYVFSKSVRLWSSIHVIGEARGFSVFDIGGTARSSRGVVIRLPPTVRHAFIVGGGDYCDNSFGDIVLRNIAVDGGGIIKIGSEGECWGASPVILENLLAWYWSNYPNGSDIYALDIWHSLHVYARQVYAHGGPALRLGTDFNNKSWNFGNSVFEEIMSHSAPSNVPNFHVYSAGNPNRTMWNLLIFIRPQTLGRGAGFWLNGETSDIRDVTIIGGNFENTPGLVLRGRVSRVFADIHYPWGIRLCKNSAGRRPDLPLYYNGKIPYDSDGRIIIYESDCQTDAGTRVAADLPTIGTDLRLLPYLSWTYPSPATTLLYDAPEIDLTRTSQSGSGVYGADNNPIRHPAVRARIPAGTTLQPGVNTFYFYTYYAPRYTPPYPAVSKWSGWEQADLDVQVSFGSFNSTYNCWQVAVRVINRSGSAVTLTSALVMLIITYYVRW